MVKIDFEAVAKETGYTNPRSASNRLAALKKSAGSSTANPNHKPAAVPGSAVRDAKVTKRKSAPRKGDKGLSKKVEETPEPMNGSEGMESEGKANT